jgi:tetratricopeptide (TPR) repeat protein
MKRAFIVTQLFLFTIFCQTVTFANANTTIQKANTAYQAGFYENAASLYEQVIEQGKVSSGVYYNLGNSYFKMDEISKAILNFERALKLDPSNEDIIYNLRVANNKIIDKIDQLPQLFYIKWWDSLKQLISPDGWAIMFTAFFFSFFLITALFLLSTSIRLRKTFLFSGLSVLIFTIISFTIAYQSYKDAAFNKEAIVFAPSLPVKSSPEESGIDLFVIHEGLKVQIIDHLTGWEEIRIANGSKGWVKSETIERI